jgi:hypothetical protein
VSAPQPRDRVSIRSHFERFPATVKGAFVVRGEDPDPHQVAIKAARAVAADGAAGRSLELAPVVLDAPPHMDVFVPFELSVSDLEPGWYGLECDADVDGIPDTFPPTRRFVVPWPRGTVRRGAVPVRGTLEGGGHTVEVQSVDCTGDSIVVHVVADPPDAPALRLSANGKQLPVVRTALDERTGRGTVSAYPLLRSHSKLSISLAGARATRLDVSLP